MRMARGVKIGPLALVCFLCSAVPPQPSVPWAVCLAAKPVKRWALPLAFREVSGLALSDDGRLWANNDEQGVIGAFDRKAGAPLGAYRLGPELPRADFEGIAVVEKQVVLVTSAGLLFAVAMPAAGTKEAVLPYRIVDTGLGKQCEIEGLAFEPTDRTLLLACKTPRAKALAGTATIFKWSWVDNKLATPDRLTISWKLLAKHRPGKAFRTSAIDRDPVTGNYLLLSSADQAYAVVDRSGVVMATGSLGPRHRQPEGVAIARDGTVLVSDEGANAAGTITAYACR